MQTQSDSAVDLNTIEGIELNLDWSQMLKVVLTFGLQQVPYAGGLASGIVGVLWPTNKRDIWAEVKGRTEELVNRKLQEYKWNEMVAFLKGFKDSISVYLDLTKVKREEQDLRAIFTRWDTIENNCVTFKDLFRVPDYEVPLLPLFTQFATLHLSLLRDGAFDGLRWGLRPDTVEKTRKRLQATYDDYWQYTTQTYNAALDHRQKIVKRDYKAVQPFRSVNAFVRDMTFTVLDFRDRWADFLVEKPVVKPLTREIFSDPAGTTAENSGSRPPNNLPPMATKPIVRIHAWGYQNLDAIQVFYPPGGAPNGTDRTPRMGTRGGSDQPDDGGNWDIKYPQDIVLAEARFGDFVHQVRFYTNGGKQLNVGGRSQGGRSVLFSCAGHILSSVLITGVASNQAAAECIIFGFRYPEVQTFTPAEMEFLYVHSLEDRPIDDFMGAFPPMEESLESIDPEWQTRWRAARTSYWDEIAAHAATVRQSE